MSRLDLIVGPNGAGKTTFYERVIAVERPGLAFVNADRIAAQRFGADAEARSYDAARIAAATRSALIDARIDFCAETVFSHPSKLALIDTAVAAGYDVVCHVVMIPAELSAARVTARAEAGGHTVPATKLPGRYQRIWPLVVASVARCTRCVFWDNAHDHGPAEVAVFRRGVADYPPRWPTWAPAELRTLG